MNHSTDESLDDEYLDDPIKLIDFEQARINALWQEAEINNSVACAPPFNLTSEGGEPTQEKHHFRLPVTFFDIPSNLKLLNDCCPLFIKVVDCDKHPWYYKKYKKSIPVDDTIIIEDDFIEECTEAGVIMTERNNSSHMHKSNISTKKACPLSQKVLQKQIEKRKSREDLEKKKAIDKKNVSNIDFKRNMGLVGLKITPIVDANSPYLSKSDTCNIPKFILDIDTALQNVGTSILPICDNEEDSKPSGDAPQNSCTIYSSQNKQTTSSVFEIKKTKTKRKSNKFKKSKIDKNKECHKLSDTNKNTCSKQAPLPPIEKTSDVKDKRKTNKYLNDLLKRKRTAVSIVKALNKIKDKYKNIRNGLSESNVTKVKTVPHAEFESQSVSANVTEDAGIKSPVLPCKPNFFNKLTTQSTLSSVEVSRLKEKIINDINNLQQITKNASSSTTVNKDQNSNNPMSTNDKSVPISVAIKDDTSNIMNKTQEMFRNASSNTLIDKSQDASSSMSTSNQRVPMKVAMKNNTISNTIISQEMPKNANSNTLLNKNKNTSNPITISNERVPIKLAMKDNVTDNNLNNSQEMPKNASINTPMNKNQKKTSKPMTTSNKRVSIKGTEKDNVIINMKKSQEIPKNANSNTPINENQNTRNPMSTSSQRIPINDYIISDINLQEIYKNAITATSKHQNANNPMTNSKKCVPINVPKGNTINDNTSKMTADFEKFKRKLNFINAKLSVPSIANGDEKANIVLPNLSSDNSNNTGTPQIDNNSLPNKQTKKRKSNCSKTSKNINDVVNNIHNVIISSNKPTNNVVNAVNTSNVLQPNELANKNKKVFKYVPPNKRRKKKQTSNHSLDSLPIQTVNSRSKEILTGTEPVYNALGIKKGMNHYFPVQSFSNPNISSNNFAHYSKNSLPTYQHIANVHHMPPLGLHPFDMPYWYAYPPPPPPPPPLTRVPQTPTQSVNQFNNQYLTNVQPSYPRIPQHNAFRNNATVPVSTTDTNSAPVTVPKLPDETSVEIIDTGTEMMRELDRDLHEYSLKEGSHPVDNSLNYSKLNEQPYVSIFVQSKPKIAENFEECRSSQKSNPVGIQEFDPSLQNRTYYPNMINNYSNIPKAPIRNTSKNTHSNNYNSNTLTGSKINTNNQTTTNNMAVPSKINKQNGDPRTPIDKDRPIVSKSNGYSPPILPISTYVSTLNLLSQAQSHSQEKNKLLNDMKRKHHWLYRKPVRVDVLPKQIHDNSSARKNVQMSNEEKSAKKISLDEYKRRTLKPDVYDDANDSPLALFNKRCRKEPATSKSVKSLSGIVNSDQDLGYDSDATVKL